MLVRDGSRPIYSEHNTIEISKSINCLGITFDKKLNFKEHINKANRCFRVLYPMLAPRSHLSTINKQLIYTSIIRPIMLYGAPIWSSAATTHTIKLNILQNKIIKTIHRLPFRTPTYLLERLTNIAQSNKFLAESNDKFIQNGLMVFVCIGGFNWFKLRVQIAPAR